MYRETKVSANHSEDIFMRKFNFPMANGICNFN